MSWPDSREDSLAAGRRRACAVCLTTGALGLPHDQLDALCAQTITSVANRALPLTCAAADLVEEAGAGTIIPPDNPEALANALRAMAAAPAEQRIAWGEAGKRYLRTTLTKSQVIPQYEDALRRVAEAR